ncbi:MAG: FAD-dependent oxidoreductase [Candidatus Anstonellales archaeon]
MNQNEIYDTIIVGTGVAGYSAAMYAGRLGMKTLVIGEMFGGTITWTNLVENYPGIKSISGIELAERLREHAEVYNVKILNDKVIDIQKNNNLFFVKTEFEQKEYVAKTIILATGTIHRKLDVPGYKELEHKGIHYCALCDAAFYKNKETAIVGGSDSAVIDALVLSNVCSKVYIIYRGNELRAEKANLEKLRNAKNIEILYNTNVVRVVGEKKVEAVELDKEYRGSKTLKISGLFIAIGAIPNSELAKKLNVETNEKGEIKINRKSETNVPGVFAAGDVTDSYFKQAITGIAEAVIAAYSAFEYIKKHHY